MGAAGSNAGHAVASARVADDRDPACSGSTSGVRRRQVNAEVSDIERRPIRS